jgi:hypothetical protein
VVQTEREEGVYYYLDELGADGAACVDVAIESGVSNGKQQAIGLSSSVHYLPYQSAFTIFLETSGTT